MMKWLFHQEHRPILSEYKPNILGFVHIFKMHKTKANDWEKKKKTKPQL